MISFFLSFFIFFLLPFFVINIFIIFFLKKNIFFSAGLDFFSVFSVFTIFMVTFCVVLFSFYYMESEKLFVYFLFSLLLFVFSMMLLCASSSFFVIFIGWDGLGITSFVLIMFYSNWKSMNNSVFTLLSNRIGDGIILVFFGLSIWDFFFLSKSLILIFFSFILLIFVSMTKSAQAPISAWLPAAMAAPTPVSALVHSSTLVAAGVVLIIKFYFLLYCAPFQKVLFFVGGTTIFVAGFSAMMEMDFKKLVAISTLSQMGMLFFILGLGSPVFCLFHLMSHAFFKSNIFLVVGYVLHVFFSQQDWRNYFSGSLFNLSQSFIMMICILCLCGLFFTSGFLSKDLVLDFMNTKKLKLLVSLLFLGGLFFTFFYSFRLFYCIFSMSILSGQVFFTRMSVMMSLSNVLLFFFSLCFCLWMMNNYLFFFSNLVFEKKIFLGLILFLIFMLFFSVFVFFLGKNMFFLDLVPKNMKFSTTKLFSMLEKSLFDKLYLFSLSESLMFWSLLFVKGLSKNMKGFFFFLGVLFFVFVF